MREELLKCKEVEVGRNNILAVVVVVVVSCILVLALLIYAICVHIDYQRARSEYMKLKSVMKVSQAKQNRRVDGPPHHFSKPHPLLGRVVPRASLVGACQLS